MPPTGNYQDLIKELARIINDKLDIPLIDEDTEQLFFEFILNLMFALLLKRSIPTGKK